MATVAPVRAAVNGDLRNSPYRGTAFALTGAPGLSDDAAVFMNTWNALKSKTAIMFFLSLTDESDRGCALVAAAFIDFRLEELLRASFVKDAKAEELLGQSKPLGTFSARIDASYAFGLIHPQLHHDLHLIRKIRNDFGHVPEPISFNEPSIASRVREFYCDVEKSQKPRKRFVGTVVDAVLSFHVYLKDAKPPLTRPDLEGTEERKRRYQAFISGVNYFSLNYSRASLKAHLDKCVADENSRQANGPSGATKNPAVILAKEQNDSKR